MLHKSPSLLLASGLLILCQGAAMATTENILLVNLDDVGLLDGLEQYAPNLSALESEALYFERCYSQPSCSPSRACVLTGLYGLRNGIGVALDDSTPYDKYLDPGTRTLAKLLPDHESAFLGKWHLGLINEHGPINYGFQTGLWNHGNAEDYWNSTFLISNTSPYYTVEAPTSGYHTDIVTTAALGAIRELREPWFVYVNFNDVHKPDDPIPDAPGAPSEPQYAKLWYLDKCVQMLLDLVPKENTHVFIFGDNGWRTGYETKGSLYETSIRVPLWWMNPAGYHGRTQQLVMLTDLYATIQALQGSASYRDGDSIPMGVGIRKFCYADKFGTRPNGSVHDRACALDGRWKLHHDMLAGEKEFYDLEADPREKNNLLLGEMTIEQFEAYEEISSYLEQARGSG